LSSAENSISVKLGRPNEAGKVKGGTHLGNFQSKTLNKQRVNPGVRMLHQSLTVSAEVGMERNAVPRLPFCSRHCTTEPKGHMMLPALGTTVTVEALGGR